MRLAILSDIHGNLIALDTVLTDMHNAGEMDAIWCLGDLAAFGSRPRECVHRMRELIDVYGPDKVRVIGGNTDRYLVSGERFPVVPATDAEAFAGLAAGWQQRDSVLNWALELLDWEDYDFLKAIIGKEIHHDLAGYGRIISFHAVPGDDESMALRPDTDDEEARDALLDRAGRLALCGHTHYSMQRVLGGWQVINPGSVGMSFSQPGTAEWALISIEGDTLRIDQHFLPYDVKAAIADFEHVGCPYPDFGASKLR